MLSQTISISYQTIITVVVVDDDDVVATVREMYTVSLTSRSVIDCVGVGFLVPNDIV